MNDVHGALIYETLALAEYEDTTAEKCMELCREEVSFKCRSIEYKASTRQCNHHGVNSDTVLPNDATGWEYYQLSGCNIDPVSIEVANVCDLIPDEGNGGESWTRYFFDALKGRCKVFQYLGTDGNSNNFQTEKECEQECKEVQFPEECALEVDVGTCDGNERRYYFNSEMNDCRRFKFGGCEGNANNFESKKECIYFCKKY